SFFDAIQGPYSLIYRRCPGILVQRRDPEQVLKTIVEREWSALEVKENVSGRRLWQSCQSKPLSGERQRFVDGSALFPTLNLPPRLLTDRFQGRLSDTLYFGIDWQDQGPQGGNRADSALYQGSSLVPGDTSDQGQMIVTPPLGVAMTGPRTHAAVFIRLRIRLSIPIRLLKLPLDPPEIRREPLDLKALALESQICNLRFLTDP